jgi:hypothetical protein
MTKILTGIAAALIVGAAALPVPAGAVERGITKDQSTDVSAQRRYYRHYGHRYWGPRRYYGHRYWGPRYRYGAYGYPYRYGYGYPYYRRPGLAFGIGPFGFGVF